MAEGQSDSDRRRRAHAGEERPIVAGGVDVTVNSSEPSILPGAKVIMRARRSGAEIRTELDAPGSYAVNLRDNVETLDRFHFRLPAVAEPDLYSIYLESAGQEVFVGDFSYTLESGRGIDLPNYPPMVVGAGLTVGNTLFVGVESGRPPNHVNRFLMESGFCRHCSAIEAARPSSPKGCGLA